jgi:Ser/Thr protein kinase RdoA (MazF antagonist)
VRPAGLLAEPAAAVPAGLAERIARERFGLDARATPLASERDANFRLEAGDGRAWVLKLTHPAEPRAVTAGQTRALLHVAQADPALPVPRLLPALDAAPAAEVVVAAGERARVARVMTLLPGVPLHRAPAHPGQHTALGRALARLHRALAGCDTTGAPGDLPWDLRRAATLMPLLPCIGDAATRGLARRALDGLLAALPALARLPAQAIHGDFQPWNVLVDAGAPDVVTGIVDFGDLVAAPPVMDLAVACAYHVHDAPDPAAPLADAAALVAAYHALRPLAADELALLPPLLAGRMAMTLAITAWRAGLHPANAGYILRNAAGAQAGLARLAALPAAAQVDALRSACAGEPTA